MVGMSSPARTRSQFHIPNRAPRASSVPCPWDSPPLVFNQRFWRAGAVWVCEKQRGQGQWVALTVPNVILLSKPAVFNPGSFLCLPLFLLTGFVGFYRTHQRCLLCASLPRVSNSAAAGGSQDTKINLLDSIITTAAAASAKL